MEPDGTMIVVAGACAGATCTGRSSTVLLKHPASVKGSKAIPISTKLRMFHSCPNKFESKQISSCIVPITRQARIREQDGP